MMEKNTMKEIAFWTAVVFIPGGILVAAYRLGREHSKIARWLKRRNKEESK